MTLEEAIKKVDHYWYTGMSDYFTFEEIFELGEMLEELKGYREHREHATDTNVGGKEG